MKKLKTKSLTGKDVIDRAIVANLQLEDEIDDLRLIDHIFASSLRSQAVQILKQHYHARELITIPGGLISKNFDWYSAPDYHFYTKRAPYHHPDLKTIKLYQKNEWSLLIARHLAPIAITVLITMTLKLYGLVTNPLVLIIIPLIVILGTAFYLPNFQIKAKQELDQIRRVMEPCVHTSFIIDGQSLYPRNLSEIMNHKRIKDGN